MAAFITVHYPIFLASSLYFYYQKGRGNQEETAAKLCGPDAGVYLLDDLLPITIGDLVVDSCEMGVNILDDLDLDGNKKGGDAAYHLARKLLAAKLNYGAGACQDSEVTVAMAEVHELPASIGFDGEGEYLSAKSVKAGLGTQENRDAAIALAEILDNYNNGDYCTP